MEAQKAKALHLAIARLLRLRKKQYSLSLTIFRVSACRDEINISPDLTSQQPLACSRSDACERAIPSPCHPSSTDVSIPDLKEAAGGKARAYSSAPVRTSIRVAIKTKPDPSGHHPALFFLASYRRDRQGLLTTHGRACVRTSTRARQIIHSLRTTPNAN
jgi:hypothetical protein